MNIVPRVTGSRVAGKNHTDKIFFRRDRVTNFKLRFAPAAWDKFDVVVGSPLPL
jgi:hypothetical protein